jgi:ABC-type transport system involved in cytochrome c biogenesis permease component
MEHLMREDLMPTETVESSKKHSWAGWTIGGLITAFMLFDAVGKFAKPVQVVQAFTDSGWPIQMATPIGTILLICTALYMIPRTSLLGSVLLTGYLGGAVATNMRLQNPLFSHTLFPVYFGVLIWVGLRLREPKLSNVFPFVR